MDILLKIWLFFNSSVVFMFLYFVGGGSCILLIIELIIQSNRFHHGGFLFVSLFVETRSHSVAQTRTCTIFLP